MEPQPLHWLADFIWGIADDVLRDLYVRGKYRDVILPMTVLRRLDAVLEPTKPAVLAMKATLDQAGITHQDPALRQAAGQAFYNTSRFTLRDLKARASQQQLKADFEAYLDGFSGYRHGVRGAGAPLQRGQQRRSRRALDAARRRQAHGEADLPAHRRPDRIEHLSAL
jgi:hypothetical protein